MKPKNYFKKFFIKIILSGAIVLCLTSNSYCGHLGVTLPDIQKEFVVYKIKIDPVTRKINDGQNGGQFSVLVEPNVIAESGWLWSWEVPNDSGNNPGCTFVPNNGESTTVSTKWYAYPDDPILANTLCTYTIKCKVTVQGKQIGAEVSSLQVDVPWATGGTTSWCTLVGSPSLSPRNIGSITEWYVTGHGSLSRPSPLKTIYVPSASQFYNKVNTHEDVHVQQWTTGIAKDFWTVTEFFDRIRNLTAPSREELILKVQDEWNIYNSEESTAATAQKNQREKEAYTVSDPISPQYIYMNGGRF